MSTDIATARTEVDEQDAYSLRTAWYGFAALALQSNGAEWLGTYGNMVRALVADLLEDDEPVRMQFLYESVNGQYPFITGDVTGIEGDEVLFADGDHEPLNDLLAVFV